MLEGIFAAMLTPFVNGTREVDEAQVRALVDRTATEGLSGLLVAGGTGEFATLSNAERRRLLEWVVDQNSGRMTIVAQTGANSTIEAVALSEHAAEVGADALMPVTPFYEPIEFADVLTYYQSIGAVSDLPIVVYNYPAAMKLRWSVDKLELLMQKVPTVCYLKDSSETTALGEHYNAADRGRLRVFNGMDLTVHSSLLAGSRGSLIGGANIAGPGLMKMYAAATGGDTALVAGIAGDLRPLFSLLDAGPYNGLLKAASRILGNDIGDTRAPYHMPSVEQVAELERVIGATPADLLASSRVVHR